MVDLLGGDLLSGQPARDRARLLYAAADRERIGSHARHELMRSAGKAQAEADEINRRRTAKTRMRNARRPRPLLTEDAR
jgi:hypothetical protein